MIYGEGTTYIIGLPKYVSSNQLGSPGSPIFSIDSKVGDAGKAPDELVPPQNSTATALQGLSNAPGALPGQKPSGVLGVIETSFRTNPYIGIGLVIAVFVGIALIAGSEM